MQELIGVSDELFWLIIIIILAITEIATARLIAVWVSIGALCALVASVFELSFPLQCFVFAITSALAVISTRPFVRRILKITSKKPLTEDIIGKLAFVVEDIDNQSAVGSARVGGRIYKAKSEKGGAIAAGTQAVVSHIDGQEIYIVEM